MKNLFVFSMVLALSLLAPVRAEDSLESMVLDTGTTFQDASQFKAVMTTRQATISGDLYLSGWGTGSGPTAYITIPLHGNVRLSGPDGLTTNTLRVDVHQGFWVHDSRSYVSEWVHLSGTVDVFRDGKRVGSSRVSGSVHVSGWASGSDRFIDLRVSGNGRLSGQITYDVGDEA